MNFSFSMSECLHRHPRRADVLAFVAGALTVVAFAPYSVAPLALVGPALLFLSWLAAASVRRAAWRGYLYGLGLFGFGVSWIYHSLSLFGEAVAPLAMPLTALFVAVLALFPAVMGAFAGRFARLPRGVRLLLLWPALWVLFEWLRGTLFTGFPWLLLGDAQVGFAPGGLAPIAGAYGVSWLMAFLGGLLALALAERRLALRVVALLLVPLIWFGVGQLRAIHWTQPDSAPFRVTLIQGNIAQQRKFQPQAFAEILQRYRDMTRAHWDSKLIVWPETAIPTLYRTAAPDYLDPLAAEARQHGSDIVLGIFRQRGQNIYNAVVSIGGKRPEFYFKHHLVPFGEYMPLKGVFGWLYKGINVPMSDLSAGRGSYVIHAAGFPVGVSVCYEDAYGAEIARALPQARLLINVSNDAWFGDSLAPAQHMQIARMRALETGRYLLRATNTGISAIVAPDGRILGLGDWGRTVAVSGDVRLMRGATPYVRFGSAPVLVPAAVIVLLGGLFAVYDQRRRHDKEDNQQ
ncbi:apolipoprotein N-acyltransferase [Acidihalobacter prosperus]